LSYDIIGYPTKEISEDDQGKFYIYSAVVKVKHPFLGEKMMNGAASQRDLLFGYTKAGGWKKASEINEINIQKKSVTNAVGRAIRALLGLNNMTWEDLPESLRGNARAKVSYKKTSNSNGHSAPQGSGSSGSPKTDLKAALHAFCDGNEEAMGDKLQELSSFKGKDGNVTFKRSVDDLSDNWAARILKDHPELQVPK